MYNGIVVDKHSMLKRLEHIFSSKLSELAKFKTRVIKP